MKRDEAEYINYDMFAGDKEGPVTRLRSVRLVTTRREQTCVFLNVHQMPPGTHARYEQAIMDDKWRSYYCCLDCMDKWMDEYE
ncbi:MAG: hypothetical protein ACXABY_09650 [Candidatus Thorarchaeota archaeon]